MLDVIEKLLILQDRDRKIGQTEIELANVAPERSALQGRLAGAQAALDAAKLKVKQIETERKRLELEVEGKKSQIEKYALQQYQTKKNEEYRALANEIDNCKAVIVQLEDLQLEQMEKAEAAQHEVARTTRAFSEAKLAVDNIIKELALKEEALGKQLSELKINYEELAVGIEEGAFGKYQRLRKTRGDSALVGIDHGVCGGCHMKLPVQIIRSCQAQLELVGCTNCGRVLYFTPHMDLVAAD